MKLKEITAFLERRAPLETAEEWDNSGLQIGGFNQEIKNVLISLDFTDEVLDSAIKNNCELIITHHPVIFKPLYQITDKNIIKALKNDISIYSAHTNLDIAENGVNDALASALGLTKVKSDGILRYGELDKDMSLDEFISYLKEKLNVSFLRVSKFNRKIRKVGVVGGSGGDFLNLAIEAGCDAFVTGEASYHLAETATKNDIMLVSAGHYETEVFICEQLKNILQENFNDLKIYNATNQNPFYCK